MNDIDFSKIIYRCSKLSKTKYKNKSIDVVGIDTEARESGKCFMICTSYGDVFTLKEFPQVLFQRKYRGKKFVAYRLGYDAGALLQKLPKRYLEKLREKEKVIYQGYRYSVIGKKCLTIARNKQAVHIYDMWNFYTGSLNYNAEKYLGMKKIDIETKKFSPAYIRKNWDRIAEYCIKDCVLVQKLAELLIKKFESFGVYPRKLYSTAYVSYQYFRQKTNYVTVRNIWNNYRKVIFYAMLAYNGGKFEVTEKGTGYFYEYDIISAYPYEIANLVDISDARVVESKKYRKSAVYGFLDCTIKIPFEVVSPLVIKRGYINTYPCGTFRRMITREEYDYMIKQGCDIKINNALWLHTEHRTYPYRRVIKNLVRMKQKLRGDKNSLEYHTIKIFLNSLYGKFVQLIKKNGYIFASTCWNPIYGAVITANVRIRISNLQQVHKTIIAVHTDSIISKSDLNYHKIGDIGDLVYDCEGKGVILGSGIYQIGEKTKLRGFNVNLDLFKLFDTNKRTISLKEIRPYSWREVIFHGWDKRLINRFCDVNKRLQVDFDSKRLWLNDYTKFNQIFKRNVESIPYLAELFDLL